MSFLLKSRRHGTGTPIAGDVEHHKLRLIAPTALNIFGSIWMCFVPIYFFPNDFLKIMGKDVPTPMEELLLKAIAMYCLFFAIACFAVASSRRAHGCIDLVCAQTGMAAYFSFVFYPVDVPASKNPFYGTPIFYAIWAVWVMSFGIAATCLYIDIVRIDTHEHAKSRAGSVTNGAK